MSVSSSLTRQRNDAPIPTAGLAVTGAKVAGGNAPIAETSRIRAWVTSGESTSYGPKHGWRWRSQFAHRERVGLGKGVPFAADRASTAAELGELLDDRHDPVRGETRQE
jgi:hypothetical protein